MEQHHRVVVSEEELEGFGEEECVLVQVSAPWCGRCPAVGKLLASLHTERRFAWCLAELPEAEGIQHRFGISRLPAIVILRGGRVLAEHQAVSLGGVEEAVRQHCPHRIVFDADF